MRVRIRVINIPVAKHGIHKPGKNSGPAIHTISFSFSGLIYPPGIKARRPDPSPGNRRSPRKCIWAHLVPYGPTEGTLALEWDFPFSSSSTRVFSLSLHSLTQFRHAA
jgi:hypothetical protein